jgi:L-seryl-tRNA(Ser) seleniumtransferase
MPSIDEVLRAAKDAPTFQELSSAYLKTIVSRGADSVRAAIGAGKFASVETRDAIMAEILREAARIHLSDEPALKPVINATGVILHTNLGRAILPESAIEALEQAARSAVNVEYDLEQGGRGDRDSLVERDLCALTGAEAAAVVNNNAAAVLLALTALAEGREAVVSRGELIEIGGSFRLPDVMVRSGAKLREVGTTNRTHARDYRDAIGPDTALLLKVHPSNYRVVGFTSNVSLAELVTIGRERGIPVIEDLGAGALIDFAPYGLPREPVVAERIAAGADLVTFSGDKLVGGPQAGIIVGKRELVNRIKSNALKRALRCDKLTLAALEATLRMYLKSPKILAEIPALRLLTRDVAEIRQMAPRAQDIIAERLGSEYRVVIVDSSCQIGSGALPTEEIPSVALKITHPSIPVDSIAAKFRRARPPIIGRIKDNAFHLDLRAIEDPDVLAVQFPAD